jgi:hypothetical protein
MKRVRFVVVLVHTADGLIVIVWILLGPHLRVGAYDGRQLEVSGRPQHKRGRQLDDMATSFLPRLI